MAATSKDNLKTKLTAIANAIRAKSGGSGKLTLDQMATQITSGIKTAHTEFGSFQGLHGQRIPTNGWSKSWTFSKPFPNTNYNFRRECGFWIGSYSSGIHNENQDSISRSDGREVTKFTMTKNTSSATLKIQSFWDNNPNYLDSCHWYYAWTAYE